MVCRDGGRGRGILTVSVAEAAGAAPGLAGSVASIGLRGIEDGKDQADEGDHEQHDEGGGEWLALGQFDGDQGRADQGGAE